jgi:hypothetical protein
MQRTLTSKIGFNRLLEVPKLLIVKNKAFSEIWKEFRNNSAIHKANSSTKTGKFKELKVNSPQPLKQWLLVK